MRSTVEGRKKKEQQTKDNLPENNKVRDTQHRSVMWLSMEHGHGLSVRKRFDYCFAGR
uniref:Uncharacterized protein n=1 Tax=Arion vulgaris TaxID=1028688 RepID=A0A0B7B8T6_9EUPU